MSEDAAGDLERRAKRVFDTVCDLPQAERAAALERECGDDAVLRAEVESLLAHHAPATADLVDGSAGRAPDADSPAASPGGDAGTRSAATIGPYRVIREIGRGGMGVVYLAEREGDHIRRRVAIKVLKRGMDTEDFLRRFELERQVLAAMNHPGIARLYDAGETEDGTPFFVMEHIEGQEIEEYCDAHRLHIDERLELFRKVCAAVHYAHQNLVVHRDLKPGNIIVTEEGQPKLLDFGIAKIINPQFTPVVGDPTGPDLRIMTPAYASPEQVRGSPMTTASDVYSLGVLLYELLSGHAPYRIRTRLRDEIVRIVCEVEPERPSTAVSQVEEFEQDDGRQKRTTTITPESVGKARESRPERLRRTLAGDIDNIVFMAMRKEPQRRYTSAEQMAEDIRRHLAGLPVIARPDTVGYRVSKFVRRNRWGVGAAVAIVVVLVAGIFGTGVGMREARAAHAEERAQREFAEAEQHRAERFFGHGRTLARSFVFEFSRALEQIDDAVVARELLVTNALAYLDAVSPDVGDDVEFARELASAYEKVGDVRGNKRNPNLGDTEGAIESYGSALGLRRQLIAAAPEDDRLQKELSTCLIRMGDILAQSGEVAGASSAYVETLAIREGILERNPESLNARRDVAVALQNVGDALVRAGDRSAARDHFERSLALRREIVERRPDSAGVLRGLSTAYTHVGYWHQSEGEHDEARRAYEEALALRRRLLAAEVTIRTRRDLVMALYYVGSVQLDLHDAGAALGHLEEGLEDARRLERDNPDDERIKETLAAMHDMMGQALAARGDRDAALTHYRDGEQLLRALARGDPAKLSYRSRTAVVRLNVADLLAAHDDLTGALREAVQAAEIFQTVVDADPDDTIARLELAGALAMVGQLHIDQDETVEAVRRLDAARSLYEALGGAGSPDRSVRRGLARCLAQFSRLMARQGAVDQALSFARVATDLDPAEPTLLRTLAQAHALHGDAQTAIAVAQGALDLLGDRNDTAAIDLRVELEEDLWRYREE